MESFKCNKNSHKFHLIYSKLFESSKTEEKLRDLNTVIGFVEMKKIQANVMATVVTSGQL